jgi:hypothetical protein
VRRHLATFLGLDPAGCAVVPERHHGATLVLWIRSTSARATRSSTTDHGYGA